MCKCTLAILSIKQPDFLPLVFSPFWGENFLVGSGRKRLNPIIYFPFSLSNQTHSKKVFLPIFFPKFSIHPISSLNKHTLKMTTFYSSQVHCWILSAYHNSLAMYFVCNWYQSLLLTFVHNNSLLPLWVM